MVFKSKAIKISGSGFLQTNSHVSLQLYMASRPLLTLRLFKRVCTQEGCMSYETFNKRYLVADYPKDIIKQILLGRPIFHGKNRRSLPSGFEQRLEDLGIIYRVLPREIRFKDKKNHILIKIKEIDG